MPLIILASDIEHGFVSPEVLGIDSVIQDNMVYLVEITEIIAFRENPFPNDYPEDLYTWNIGEEEWNKDYEWNGSNLIDLGLSVYNFDLIALQDTLSYILPILDVNDSWELIILWGDAFDTVKKWDKNWEYYNDLEDFSLSNVLRDLLGFVETTREWVSIVYDEWEVTIWNYEEQWNDDKVWVWEGKGTIITCTITDILGITSALTSNEIYIVNTEDIVGFTWNYPYVMVAVFLDEHLALDSEPTFLPSTYDMTLSDSAGFPETLGIYYYILHTIIEQTGFPDVLSSAFTTYNYLNDEIAFKDHEIKTKDHILYWRTRTHNYVMGFGGGPYGAFEYGGGEATDIKEFRVMVYNSLSGALLRDVTIALPDKTEDDPNYVYEWVDNIADNTWYNHALTFDVYEIDIVGALSEKRTVIRDNMTPLSISNCIMWVHADTISGVANDSIISQLTDLSSVGNNLYGESSGGNGLRVRLGEGPRGHNYIYAGYNGYGWAAGYNRSMKSMTSKLSIFAVGFCNYGESYGTPYSRFIYKDSDWYFGYRSGKMNRFYFVGGYVYDGATDIDGTWHCWSATIAGTGYDSYVYRDGNLLAHNQNGVGNITTTFYFGGYPCWAYLCELIMYNRELNPLEVDDLHGYLMYKYLA